MVGGKHKG
jgi:hypothetical protein